MSATFDAAKGYKRICFREDRDLLDTELNELQEIAITERRELLDRVYAPGTILDGLAATGAGMTLTVAEGLIYLDGHAVRVPGATLTCGATGVQMVWVDVFQRNITVADDPSLINPLTGEPTAEREKWIATLQTRDTSGDPLPEGASGRTVVAVMTYEPATGTISRLQPRPLTAGDATLLDQHAARLQTHETTIATLNTRTESQDAALTALTTQQANHHGKGGAVHPAATQSQAGFMSPADKVTLDALAQTAPVHHHDDRYYTEGEIAGLLAGYAPLSHVGAGGSAHAVATDETAGFLSAADKAKLHSIAVGANVAPRTATVVVAASDAPASAQSGADYLCDGTDDHVEIQAAMSSLQAAGGGKLHLTEGTFSIAGAVLLTSSVMIEGRGDHTTLSIAADAAGTWWVFDCNAAYDPAVHSVTIRDLLFRGNAVVGPGAVRLSGWGNGMERLSAHAMANSGSGTFLIASASESWVRACRSSANNSGVCVSHSQYCIVEDNIISDSMLTGIQLYGSSDCLVAHNLLRNNGISAVPPSSQLHLNGLSTRCTVQGNMCRCSGAQPTYGLWIASAGGTSNKHLVTNNDLLTGGATALKNDDPTTVVAPGNRTT